jgi:hypothetical protein
MIPRGFPTAPFFAGAASGGQTAEFARRDWLGASFFGNCPSGTASRLLTPNIRAPTLQIQTNSDNDQQRTRWMQRCGPIDTRVAVLRYPARPFNAEPEGDPSLTPKKQPGPAGAGKSSLALINGGRDAVSIEYLLVKAADQRSVLADGEKVGVTNHIMMLPADEYTITLEGSGYTPAQQDVVLAGTSVIRPAVLVFQP